MAEVIRCLNCERDQDVEARGMLCTHCGASLADGLNFPDDCVACGHAHPGEYCAAPACADGCCHCGCSPTEYRRRS